MPDVTVYRGTKVIFSDRLRIYIHDYRAEPFVRQVLEALNIDKFDFSYYRIKQDGKYLLSRTDPVIPCSQTYIYLHK